MNHQNMISSLKKREYLVAKLLSKSDVERLWNIIVTMQHIHYLALAELHSELVHEALCTKTNKQLLEVISIYPQHSPMWLFVILAILQENRWSIYFHTHYQNELDFSVKKLKRSKTIQEHSNCFVQVLSNLENIYGKKDHFWFWDSECGNPFLVDEDD